MACRTVPTVDREVGRWDNPAHVYEELTPLLYKVRSACPLTFCQGGRKIEGRWGRMDHWDWGHCLQRAKRINRVHAQNSWTAYNKDTKLFDNALMKRTLV
jgi:hypothetical protein